jgi:hypothetical protein
LNKVALAKKYNGTPRRAQHVYRRWLQLRLREAAEGQHQQHGAQPRHRAAPRAGPGGLADRNGAKHGGLNQRVGSLCSKA